VRNQAGALLLRAKRALYGERPNHAQAKLCGDAGLTRSMEGSSGGRTAWHDCARRKAQAAYSVMLSSVDAEGGDKAATASTAQRPKSETLA
jgi:hypothetical protein